MDNKQETKDGGDSVVINSSKQQQAERFVTYEECRRNHAASIGKYAVDGCCEFMPSVGGKSGGCAEAAMWCAACSCHRNFHKKVVRRRHQETTTEYSKSCDRCNNLSAYEYKPPSTPK